MALQETGRKRQLADKFYTNPVVAKKCLQKLIELVPNPGGFVWTEPSAGSGAFLNALAELLPTSRAIGLDLDPGRSDISKGDFFEWDMPAEVGPHKIFFGNPPFGRQSSLARRFIQRAAELGADWIAFILPRSFEKPSLQKFVPSVYHLRASVRLEPNAFLVNGRAHDVPCVFQIWEKKDVARTTVASVQPTGYAYVKSTEPFDIAIRRVGVFAGAAYLGGGTFSPQSHYFVKLTLGTEKRGEIVQKLSAHPFPSNTTGPRSLSKGEISAVLNGLVAQEETTLP
jgi:hypothetical protein